MLAKGLFLILVSTFLCSCSQTKNQEETENLKSNIKKSTRIQIRIIPDRNSEMSLRALDISTKDSVSYISEFVKEVEPTHVKIFSSLPDGYLSLYQGDTHKMDIYFALDSLNGKFQALKTNTEFEITTEGIDYLTRIYLNKAVWEPKKVE